MMKSQRGSSANDRSETSEADGHPVATCSRFSSTVSIALETQASPGSELLRPRPLKGSCPGLVTLLASTSKIVMTRLKLACLTEGIMKCIGLIAVQSPKTVYVMT
jgi:hypothetical protein